MKCTRFLVSQYSIWVLVGFTFLSGLIRGDGLPLVVIPPRRRRRRRRRLGLRIRINSLSSAPAQATLLVRGRGKDKTVSKLKDHVQLNFWSTSKSIFL